VAHAFSFKSLKEMF